MNGRCILLVEDDHASRQVWIHQLRAVGYFVQEARDGEQAIELFSPRRHGLVITDLAMPGRDGFEVVRTIKDRAPHVPVLVMTAFGYRKIVVEAERVGADEIIYKPFTRNALLDLVNRWVTWDERRDEVRR